MTFETLLNACILILLWFMLTSYVVWCIHKITLNVNFYESFCRPLQPWCVHRKLIQQTWKCFLLLVSVIQMVGGCLYPVAEQIVKAKRQINLSSKLCHLLPPLELIPNSFVSFNLKFVKGICFLKIRRHLICSLIACVGILPICENSLSSLCI